MTLNKTAIEWCDRTWNPVTGCQHGCPYCYARKIAERFHGPAGFIPAFHPERLMDPEKQKKPQTIFVCSMSDLFGDWVPKDWLNMVFASIQRAKQHTYIFLTKNPARYKQIPATYFSKNTWWGTTVTKQEDYHRILTIQSLPGWVNTFVSFEPLLGSLDLDLKGIKQVIIGSQTNPTVDPSVNNIINIEKVAKENDTKVFCKNSLSYLNIGDQNNLFKRELAWELQK